MTLKDVAGIELWVILLGVSVDVAITRKTNGRNGVLLSSAVVYDSQRLVSLELSCRE